MVSEWLCPLLVAGRGGFPVAELACLATAFAGGTMVGSFINVVVHRVPAGRTVVSGCSRCPHCGHPVRWHDNVPVLGWLVLRGRCRDCGVPIAPGYPLVEAACGGISVAIAAAVLAGIAAPGDGPAIDRLLSRGDWRPVFAWFHPTALVLAVLAWILLAAHGHLVSCRTMLVAAAVAALAAAMLPALEPPGILPDGTPWPQGSGALRPALAVLVGGAAAWIGGGLLGCSPVIRRAGVLVGAGLGWQIAIGFQVLARIAGVVGRRLPILMRISRTSGGPDT